MRFRSKEADRIIAPVIAQPAIDQNLVVEVRVHWQEFDRGHPQFFQILDRTSAPQSGVGSAQFSRHIWAEPCKTLHVHFINHRTVQRRPRPFVVAPVECVIDHDTFRNAPGVVAKIARKLSLRAADDVSKHLVSPVHLPRDRLRVRIDQQLRAVETHAALRIVRPINAEAIELPRSHIR